MKLFGTFVTLALCLAPLAQAAACDDASKADLQTVALAASASPEAPLTDSAAPAGAAPTDSNHGTRHDVQLTSPRGLMDEDPASSMCADPDAHAILSVTAPPP